MPRSIGEHSRILRGDPESLVCLSLQVHYAHFTLTVYPSAAMPPTGIVIVPKSDIGILNQHIDDDCGVYRIRSGHRVHYLHIPTTVFDEDTMCRPHLLIPNLPEFPAADWTSMRIFRDTYNVLQYTLSSDLLPLIQNIWHPVQIDVLPLPQIERYKSAVREVIHQDRPAVSKIACFDWKISNMENELWAYYIISRYKEEHPNLPSIAPEFLGHLTENGRVVGMLLEKLEGDFASITDLDRCREALQVVHAMGLIHGDINRHNFIVDRATSRVRIVNFEHADEFDEELARQEMEALAYELSEDTGRGGVIKLDGSVLPV